MIKAHDNKGVGTPSRGLRAIPDRGAPKTRGFSHQRKIENILRGIVFVRALNAATRPRVPKVISIQISGVTVSGALASTAFMMLSDANEDALHTKPTSQIVSMRLARLRNSF
jgi:hypothetical protein